MTIIPSRDTDRRNMFRTNLSCFPAYIQDHIRGVDIDEVWKHVEVVFAPDGNPICKVWTGERLIHINSLHPVQQAQHWENRIQMKNLGSTFVYGCGFGYPLFEVLKNVPSDSVVVVFEPNIHLFIAMLHYFDLRPIFAEHAKCIFFIGNPPDFSQDFSNLMLTYNLFQLTAPTVLFTPSTKLFKQQYMELHRRILEWLPQHVFTRGNHHYDSLVGFHNIIANTEVILESPYLSSLKGKFPNTPAFIVANGPSLDKNIRELKNVQGKGLILCCESAIIPLMKNGIQPDAIIVAERDPESYLYHFQNYAYPKEIALLALSVADPRTFASFLGPKIPIFRSLESTSQWLNHLLGDGSGLFGGINVSHLAYETAVYLGANPIVLVGQDLAYGADGLTHSKQSKYAEAGQDYIAGIHALPVVYVEGNDGTLIPSIESWVEYKKWLERLIAQNPQVSVLNATEGGAKIQGTKTSQLGKVIEHYCQDDLPTRLSQLILEETVLVDVEARKQKTAVLLLELKKYILIYRTLLKFVSQTDAASAQLWDAPEQRDAAEFERALRETYEQNQQTLHRFLQPRVHQVFFQQVILYGFHHINQLGAINTLPKLRIATQIQMEIFDYLTVICQSLIRNFQIASDKLSLQATELHKMSNS